jgi:hypothetical protein
MGHPAGSHPEALCPTSSVRGIAPQVAGSWIQCEVGLTSPVQSGLLPLTSTPSG